MWVWVRRIQTRANRPQQPNLNNCSLSLSCSYVGDSLPWFWSLLWLSVLLSILLFLCRSFLLKPVPTQLWTGSMSLLLQCYLFWTQHYTSEMLTSTGWIQFLQADIRVHFFSWSEKEWISKLHMKSQTRGLTAWTCSTVCFGHFQRQGPDPESGLVLINKHVNHYIFMAHI